MSDPESTKPSTTAAADEVDSDKKRKDLEETETSKPAASPAAGNTDKKKKKNNNNNNNRDRGEKNRNNSNKRRKHDKDDLSHWRTRPDQVTGKINTGSFAHPPMREKFGVELPAVDEANKGEEEETRVKRKVAFLLAYLGTNYTGFQMNDVQRTLQAEFELALLRAKLLTRSNFGYPFKYSWSTSGRTDKGVHACAQVCSAKIEIRAKDQEDMTQVLEELNQVLPPDIRVLDVNRVSKSFCAKTQRYRVRYQYMIPSFLLMPVSELRPILEASGAPTQWSSDHGRDPGNPFLPEEIAALQTRFQDYRVSPEQLSSLREALKKYEGTHSFHNFSKRVAGDEARADRYIVSYNVEEPMVFANGMQWIPTQVVGQSFLLHQIRKMIAMAVDVARGVAPLSILERAFSRDEVIRIAPAPAQGLFLEMSYYDLYNERKSKTNPDLPDLEWTDESSDVYRRWKQFRNDVLMKHVVDEEKRDSNFIKYLYQQEFINDTHAHYKLDDDDLSKNNGKETTTKPPPGEQSI